MLFKHRTIIKVCSFILCMAIPCQIALAWNAFRHTDPKKNDQVNASRDAVSHNRQGLVYLEQGYILHAIGEFKLAIMLNPNSTSSATYYNNLGRAYEKLKEFDLAIMSYQHAIKINPDFALYYKNLVHVYQTKKAMNKAQEDYEKIIETNPQDAQAFFILGLIYQNQNEPHKAVEAFQNFLHLQPGVDLALAAKKYLHQLGVKPSE